MKGGRFRLEEMPKRIIPADPELGFKNSKNNTHLAIQIMNSKKSILIETTELGNHLYKCGNRFVMVDPHRRQVVYSMKWRDSFFKLLNMTVSEEVLHWRDRGLFETRNLTSHVFFDLLFPIHNSVMCDFKHTEDGERFWLKMIDESFDRDLNIYSINFLQTNPLLKNKIVKLNNKLDFYHLLNANNSPWGDENKFMARRLLITQKSLTVKVDNK